MEELPQCLLLLGTCALYLEVLDATGNSTKYALKGGGSYSPEGFPLQTCN
jgi:hypothetical protein